MTDRKRIHIGCGAVILPGWINVDIEHLPGVDLVLDVRGGLPFNDVGIIFAEAFIEHLDFHSGLRFLADCRRVLCDSGLLRLSTPNLDWVWRHQYHQGAWMDDGEAVRDCFWMNKAFHGWGHQFLYNRQTLTEVLKQAGFGLVESTTYGESRHAELRGLEHHDKDVDSPDVPHVIILEASGRSSGASDALVGPRADFEQAMAIRAPASYAPARRTSRSGLVRFLFGEK